MLYQGTPYTPPPPPPDQAPVSPPAHQVPPPSTAGAGLAVTGLVLGIVALVFVVLIAPLRLWPDLLGLACAIGAVICGHVAQAHGRNGSGQGLAVAALVLGYVALGLGLLHVIGLLLFYADLRARFPRFR